MATLLDAVKITRALLNDDDGLTWADHLVIPKVQQAWGELLAKFQLNGIPVILEGSAPIRVIANGTGTVLTVPTDFQEPITLKEYGVNETQDNAVNMTQVDFLPNILVDSTLRYWNWMQQQVTVFGCSVDRNVLVHYIKKLAAPTRLADVLSINQCEIFLGPRTAAIIQGSLGKLDLAQGCDAMAQQNLGLIVRAQIKRMQSLPVRRRPFSSRRSNRSF